MRTSSKFGTSFKFDSQSGAKTEQIDPARKTPPHRGTLAAFLCALAAVTIGFVTFATDVKSVMAFGDDNPASFFRNDRARSSGGGRSEAPRYYAPVPTIRSIFGGGGGSNPLRATIPNYGNSEPRAKKAKRLKAKSARVREAASERLPKIASVSRRENDKADVPAGPARASTGSRSVCVRLCDGYHFPVGDAPGSGGVADHEAVCSATCPDAPTRLYVIPAGSDSISDAFSAREGRSYSALPVALRYTEKRDNTCSCRRNNAPQMSLVSLYRDFTLRSGDAVMTGEGFQVFKGASKWPYKPRDFAALRSSPIDSAHKRHLQSLERASRRAIASPREQPDLAPRTAASPVPALGPFLVKKQPSHAATEIGGARTAQASAPQQIQ